jgi:hypothetical protein
MIDLSLDSKVFIRNSLDAAVQELDLLLNTTNTELIGYPSFGTEFEQFLWQMTPSPNAIKQYVQEKIYDTFFLSKMNVNINVEAIKGEFRYIYYLFFNITDSAGNSVQRKYQFR